MRNHAKASPPCHPERSGTTGVTANATAQNRRAVEPRRGASRRDLRWLEAGQSITKFLGITERHMGRFLQNGPPEIQTTKSPYCKFLGSLGGDWLRSNQSVAQRCFSSRSPLSGVRGSAPRSSSEVFPSDDSPLAHDYLSTFPAGLDYLTDFRYDYSIKKQPRQEIRGERKDFYGI